MAHGAGARIDFHQHFTIALRQPECYRQRPSRRAIHFPLPVLSRGIDRTRKAGADGIEVAGRRRLPALHSNLLEKTLRKPALFQRLQQLFQRQEHIGPR